MGINNNNYQKNANISILLRLLWQNPGLSRIDIARKLDIYKSTVTNIISILLENHVVMETEVYEAAAQGGRKPIGLTINPNFGAVLGIEIQPEYYRATLLDFTGQIKFSRRGKGVSSDPDEAVQSIVRECESAIESAGIPLLGICVGFPGIIDPSGKRIIRSLPFNLEDYSTDQLAKRFTVPLFFENDANSGAWGQLLQFGGGQTKDFLYLLMECHESIQQIGKPVGLGVGFGVVIRDEVYYGSSFSAGEFRSSEWKAGNSSQVGMDNESIGRVMNEPGLYRAYLQEVFRNLVPVISVLNPDKLVIGGDLSGNKELVNTIINEHLLPLVDSHPEKLKVEFSTFGDLDVAAGAAGMFIRKLISVPELKNLSTNLHFDWEQVFEMVKRERSSPFR